MILQPKLLVGFIGVFRFTEFGGFNGSFVYDSSSQKCFFCVIFCMENQQQMKGPGVDFAGFHEGKRL